MKQILTFVLLAVTLSATSQTTDAVLEQYAFQNI